MLNTISSRDFSHYPDLSDMLLFFVSFFACSILTSFTFPKADSSSSRKDFPLNTSLQRYTSMFSIKPISIFQRFFQLNLILKSTTPSFSPINITTTSHLRSKSALTDFQIHQIACNTNNSQYTIFYADMLKNSALSLNLLFEGNLSSISQYSLLTTSGCENVVQNIITIRTAYFLLSVVAFFLYHSKMKTIIKGFFSLHPYHLVQLILVFLILSNFPFMILNFIFDSSIVFILDDFMFSLYHSFFLPSLLYFCFYKNKRTASILACIFTLILFFINCGVKFFESRALYFIYIRIGILMCYLGLVLFLRNIKEYETSINIFLLLVCILSLHIILDIFNYISDYISSIYIRDSIIIQFISISTFAFISLFLPNKLDNINENNLDVGLITD